MILMFLTFMLVTLFVTVVWIWVDESHKLNHPVNNYNANYRKHGTRADHAFVCPECLWLILKDTAIRQSTATDQWVHEQCPKKVNKNPGKAHLVADRSNGITPAQRTEMDRTERSPSRPSKLSAQVKRDLAADDNLTVDEYTKWANSEHHDQKICLCCVDLDDEES